eukprot:TRINITY_DN29_c0_g1_i1.p1 TRINITY_DN29_c0_g1~~TRINITY_DN29_c0_g1_i1.p1  ORF type:complete len:576 (-),score=96.73 TRINITY_DN29_c0_g1_i1:54-1781(-)
MSLYLVVLFAACLVPCAGQNGGGLRGPNSWAPWESSPFEVSALLLELESIIGADARKSIETRLERAEERLRIGFQAMPKNEYGNLAPDSVRYALHRYFTKNYAWVMKGLFTNGEAWNSSSPLEVTVLKDRLPGTALQAFARRLQTRGLGLRDIAVFAATIESLIHSDLSVRAQEIWEIFGLRQEQEVDAEKFDAILHLYLAGFIMRVDFTDISVQVRNLDKRIVDRWVQKISKTVGEVYPSWPKSSQFLTDIRTSAMGSNQTASFPVVLAALDKVVDTWGPWRVFDCTNTKKLLLDIEDQHSGCVRLADFYRSHTEKGVWQFAESVEYLREQGCLDETAANDPHLIISNYLNAQGNCLSSSGFYSVCCMNECEDLMADLETQIQADRAAPEVIAAVVASMPSATVPANRTLSATSMQYLNKIASRHDGIVPLHSRLFGQWMHFEYPRECSYPHVSGTTSQVNPWEYEDEEGDFTSTFNHSQAKSVIQSLRAQNTSVVSRAQRDTCAAWNDAEEFIVHHPSMTLAELEQDQDVWNMMAFMMLVSGLVATGIMLWRMVLDARRALARKEAPKRVMYA